MYHSMMMKALTTKVRGTERKSGIENKDSNFNVFFKGLYLKYATRISAYSQEHC